MHSATPSNFHRPVPKRYVYGKPPEHRAVVIKLELDVDLDAKLQAISQAYNWHEGHLLRYLLLLGLHQFRLRQSPEESEVGMCDAPTAE